jgi:hypothetical protein
MLILHYFKILFGRKVDFYKNVPSYVTLRLRQNDKNTSSLSALHVFISGSYVKWRTPTQLYWINQGISSNYPGTALTITCNT